PSMLFLADASGYEDARLRDANWSDALTMRRCCSIAYPRFVTSCTTRRVDQKQRLTSFHEKSC
ncbi:MAG: hypothetical protein AAGF97_08640, partial [Planctomycetota bacterium]